MAAFGIQSDTQYIKSFFKNDKTVALKMYYLSVVLPLAQIYEYFTLKLLEVAQYLGKSIILHPLGDIIKTRNQIEKILNDFTRLIGMLTRLNYQNL